MKLHQSLSRTIVKFGIALGVALGVAASASVCFAQSAHADQAFQKMLANGFQDKGIATTKRLQQDAIQKFCSEPDAVTKHPKQAEKLMEQSLANVKYPSNQVYLGDWKVGEKIAQNGRGMTWSDAAGSENGGNCYNCHQIDKKEISFGTIGPSLYQYGKLRGNSAEMLKYTWAKIYNAKAYGVCSNMPRFGHMGILTEKEMQDLMALLFDPTSPVNQ